MCIYSDFDIKSVYKRVSIYKYFSEDAIAVIFRWYEKQNNKFYGVAEIEKDIIENWYRVDWFDEISAYFGNVKEIGGIVIDLGAEICEAPYQCGFAVRLPR